MKKKILTMIALSMVMISACGCSADFSSSVPDKEDSASASEMAIPIDEDKKVNKTYDLEGFRIDLPNDMEPGSEELVKQVFGTMTDIRNTEMDVQTDSLKDDDIIFVHAVIDYDGILTEQEMIGGEYAAVSDAATSLMSRASAVLTETGSNYIEFDDDPDDGEPMHYRVVFAVSGTKLYHFAFGTSQDSWDKYSDKVHEYIRSIAIGKG